MHNPSDTGADLLAWAKDLYPINRSLTGPGVRETLRYLQNLLPGLKICEVQSGAKAMDWTVPKEWVVHEAYVETLDGKRVIDFSSSNLHVVGYSTPIDEIVSREVLEKHLHSLPNQPTAIPYITSYYSENWGFCIKHEDRELLTDNAYHVVIRSQLKNGVLNYGELIIEGETSEEVLLSTYICHPSMANNELSGPVVMAALGRWLSNLPNRRFTYRILFLAETIGAIVYLSKHLVELQNKVVAGWVLTCIGDNRTYSYLPSRNGHSLSDRISLKVLAERGHDFTRYSFLDRGSDERQWCAPGVDLPVCSLMRTKYGQYPEYHTSLDDFSVVTEIGLQGGLDMMVECIALLEENFTWKIKTLGEPQLGKRGLYPNLSTKASNSIVRDMMNVITYCDGMRDVVEISNVTKVPTSSVREITNKLFTHDLLDKI